eukprot:s1558_g23.t1
MACEGIWLQGHWFEFSGIGGENIPLQTSSGQQIKCRRTAMRAGAPDPWALQEAILKEERLFDDHRTMIQAGEDVRRTARMNPKELKYMSKTASVPSFRSTLTVRDRTFLREFHERPRKAQQLDVYAPYVRD